MPSGANSGAKGSIWFGGKFPDWKPPSDPYPTPPISRPITLRPLEPASVCLEGGSRLPPARLESPPAPPRRGACSVRGLAQPLGHGTHTNRLSGGLLDPLPASGRACILSGIPHGGFRHETPDWISCRCAAGNRLRHRNPKACQRRHLLHIRGLSCRLHRKGRCRAPPAPGCAGSCARSGAAWNADELWWSRQPRGPALKALDV